MSGFRDGVIDTAAILAWIERLVAIESPTSDPAGVNRVLDAIAPMFGDTSATLTREIVGPRFGEMLRVSCPGEGNGAGILVLSHVDTVHPPGTLAGDLPIRREGDRLYGPGVFDMKGGAVLAITAYLRLASSGRRPKLPVTFLFTPDEETGSIGTRSHIEAAARASKYVLVTEPRRSGGRVVTSRKGTGRFQIDAHGRPSHAGTHHADGRSAIRAIARTILEIEAWTDYQRGITTNFGLVSGGTGVNVVPEHARITADVRVVDPAMAIEMDARFRGLVPQEPGVTLQVTGGMTRPPWNEDAGTKALLDKVQAIGREIGLELEAGPRTGGGSDANFTAAIGIPTIDGLGVEGRGRPHAGGAHADLLGGAWREAVPGAVRAAGVKASPWPSAYQPAPAIATRIRTPRSRTIRLPVHPASRCDQTMASAASMRSGGRLSSSSR